MRSILSLLLTLALFTQVLPPHVSAESGNDPVTVLVFGGTGRLGSEVARSLSQAGHHVTVFARPSSNRERLAGIPAAFVLGDVLVEADVLTAVQQTQPQVIVDALSRGRAPADFYATSAAHIATAASQAGVEQIILHGSVGAGDSAKVLNDGISASMRRLFEQKGAGENAVINSGVPYTIIRNWQVRRYGTGASGTAALTEDQSATDSVSRADLAQLTLACFAKERCLNRIFHAIQQPER